ncbi:MAG: thioredoxin family protein [Planctomycetes bacterium]|nr:thioredoxin family protein [Planctomycetota bacterium]
MPRISAPLLAIFLFLSVGQAWAADEWGTDLKRIEAEAQRRRVPILLLITGSDWCPYCMWIKKAIFATPEFKRWSKGVVRLIADFPRKTKLPKKLSLQNTTLQKRYKTKSYPTLLLLDYKGALLGDVKYVKQDNKTKWLARANALIEARFNPRTGLALAPGAKPVKRRAAPEPIKAPPPSKPKKDARAATGKTWFVKAPEALDEAGRTKRKVLALFTCSDRGAASKSLQTVLESDAFKSWADKELILLEIDFPVRKRQSPRLKLQNVKLKQEYHVGRLPEVVFLSADGKVIARVSKKTKLEPGEWVKAAKASLKGR